MTAFERGASVTGENVRTPLIIQVCEPTTARLESEMKSARACAHASSYDTIRYDTVYLRALKN